MAKLGDFNIVLLITLLAKTTLSVQQASIQESLRTYEEFVNTSLLLERDDKAHINTWIEEMQVQLVDVTTRYRLEMTKHQQHNFRKLPMNKKWQECLKFYHKAINKLEQAYYLKENECLKNASSADGEKRQAVTQVGREIRKWRRSYRYLKNLCQTNNPGNEEQAGVCLVQYMERDNYSYAFQRLINLRLAVVQELHIEMNRSIVVLEECLKVTLSRYLEEVRNTMEFLSRCYGGEESIFEE